MSGLRTVCFCNTHGEEQAGAGSYLSAETLPAGRWIARVTIAVGDQRWMDEAEVQ